MVASSQPLSGRDWFGLLCVLIIAACFRLEAVGYNHYLADEADLAQIAQGVARGDGLPRIGILSSVGVPNSPISVYIMAVPFIFTGDPWIATAYVALLNVAGVALLWWLAYRLVNVNVGFWASLIYAVSPWAIWYSSRIWAQDLHTPFVLLGLACGILGFVDGKRWAQFAAIPIFFAALQIHFATLLIFPLLLLLMWVGRKRISWPAVIGGSTLAGFTVWIFITGLLNYGFGAGGFLGNALRNLFVWRSEPFLFTWWKATGLGMTSVISFSTAEQMTLALPAPTVIWSLLGVLTLAGLILVRSRARIGFTAVLLWAWIGLPLAGFVTAWTPIREHYYVHVIPALCLASAIAVDWLDSLALQRDWRWARVSILVSLVLVLQVSWWRGLLRYLDTTPMVEQGTPLHYLMNIRQSLMQADDILIAVDGSKQTEFKTWRPFLYKAATCVRRPVLAGDSTAVILPQAPFTVLAAPDSPTTPYGDLYTSLSTSAQQLQFAQRPGDAPYKVYLHTAQPIWRDATFTPIAEGRFDNGATLTGYAQVGDQVQLRWRIDRPLSADFQYFVHFLNSQGDKLAQRDAGFANRYFICTGDEVIMLLMLPRPAEAKTLRVGMYRFGTTQGTDPIASAHLNDAGERGLPWVDLALQP